MKRKPATSKTVVVGVAAVPLTSSSPERIAILVSSSVNDVWISTNPAMAVGQGIHVNAAAEPVEFCSCHFGTEVQKAWYAIAAGAGTNVFIMEGFDEWHGQDRR